MNFKLITLVSLLFTIHTHAYWNYLAPPIFISQYSQISQAKLSLKTARALIANLNGLTTKEIIQDALRNEPELAQQYDYIEHYVDDVLNNDDSDIPVDILFGAIETICGAVLWVTPFRNVGVGLIVDGVRRMLNEAAEIAKNRREEHANSNLDTTDSPIPFEKITELLNSAYSIS